MDLEFTCDSVLDAVDGLSSGVAVLCSGCGLLASTLGIACEGPRRVMVVVPSAADIGCGAISFSPRVLL